MESTRFVDTYSLGERKESTMAKRRTYPLEFRQQMVELVRSGRKLVELVEGFSVSEQAIRNWIKQADVGAGKRADGLSTQEKEELQRLRRENEQLRTEREILGKAAAWFARETDAVPPRSSRS
jgi:transposase